MTLLLTLFACATDPTPDRVAHAEPAPQQRTSAVRLLGRVHGEDDISGGALVDGVLYVVSDEGGGITRLRPEGTDFRADAIFPLPSDRPDPDDGPELDLEALCAHPGGLIAVGSHSAKRKKVKDGKSHAKNLERLATIEPEPARRVLLPLTVTDGVVSGTPIPGFDALSSHPILAPFVGLPSKENGLDIEGATCTADTLTLGFRGPVLRQNLVPVVDLALPSGARKQTRYLALDGEGIRDLARVDDGWLVLTGPVGDGPATGALLHWDGRDCLPADDRPACVIRELDRWPALDGRKAEALIVESADPLQVLLLWDGAPGGVRKGF